MDSMTMYEAKDIAKNTMYTDRTERELERYQLYVAIQTNSKKRYKPEDIMQLPWDNKWLDKTEFEYNKEDDERTESKANSIADMLNKGMLSFETTNIMNESKSHTNT